MKKLLLTGLTFVYFIQTIFSQIPNGGFENWTMNPFLSSEEPDGWVTSNLLIILGTPRTVKSTTSSYSGAKAIEMENVGYKELITNNEKVAVGFCATGKLLRFSADGVQLGFPIGSRPSSITGQYKFNSSGKDTAAIVVGLHKWNPVTKSRDSIGGTAVLFFLNSNTYVPFASPIFYLTNSVIPDTAIVYLSSSITDLPVVGTKLTIDNLVLTGATANIDVLTSDISNEIFPNPSSNDIFIKNINKNTRNITLKNMAGATVHAETISPSSDITSKQISVADFPTGVYILETKDENQLVLQRAKLTVSK